MSGLEIIYIQVANLTAPVAQSSHSIPSYLNETTHKSAMDTPGLCSLFVYKHHPGWLLCKGCFQQLGFQFPQPSTRIPPLSHKRLCGHNVPVVDETLEGQCVFALCGLVIPV